MIQIKESQIDEIITVCPYCMNESHNKTSCCGESSAHFETAVACQDEVYLKSEINIIKDE